jgi:hypothetical protein
MRALRRWVCSLLLSLLISLLTTIIALLHICTLLHSGPRQKSDMDDWVISKDEWDNL